MCEQTEIDYLDGDIVWVKLGSCWWPGEVVSQDSLPPDVLPSFRKPPIAVVKFFQETTYEYVKNINSIYKYNCSRKNEFINKGLYMYRTKHGHMEKFPEDVIRAETAVGGDKEILTQNQFQEVKKESYAGLFGESAKKTPSSGKRGRSGRGRPPSESPKISTPIRKFYKEKSDYKVHILLQGSKEPQRQSTESISTPSTSRAESEPAEEKTPKVKQPASSFSTPTPSSSGTYACHSCPFSTSRLNVLILHNKTHSSTFTPYIPSPVRKKASPKSSKSTPKTSKTPKTPRPRKEKTDKPKKTGKKRAAEDEPDVEVKKLKTDQEIKSSLLADWDDDVEEDSNDASSANITSGSPEIPVGADSPAVPTLAELPVAQIPAESSSPVEKKPEEHSNEKPESSSDCKYEFCEDEDWPVEADGGRKIPRVKNPSKRKEETKSLSVDDDDVAKEVAELLNKTVVPELPSIPEPLKVEENFPEPPVVKSPDKKPENLSEDKNSLEKTTEAKPKKPIFKTKTFFRSRHSRSQDAIGKYVAEQLNAKERMDMSENEINGSEAVSSPEARESPPVEHVKVARLAPKIQLKKMKAEAAQLREKEKTSFYKSHDSVAFKPEDTKSENIFTLKIDDTSEKGDTDKPFASKSLQDVLYPTQEIKPINKETPEKLHHKDNLVLGDDIFESTDKLNSSRHITDEITSKKLITIQDTVNELGINKENFSLEPLEASPKKSNIQPTNPEKNHDTNLRKLTEEWTESPSPVNNCEEILQESIQQFVEKPSHFVNSGKTNRKTSEEPTEIAAIEKVITSPDKTHPSPPTVSPTPASPKQPLEPTEIPSPKLTEASPKKSNHQSTESSIPTVKIPEGSPKLYEHLDEPFMSESTASAVDALLSVSRETDRVPRIVGNDPPEDLFEDDNKDTNTNNESDIINTDITINNGICQDIELDNVNDEKKNSNLSEETNVEVSHEGADQHILPEESSFSVPTDDIMMSGIDNVVSETIIESIPSESDLQIAETLLNLPSTAIKNKTSSDLQENISMPICLDNEEFQEEVIPASETIIQDDNNVYQTDKSDIVDNTEVTTEQPLLTNNDSLNIRYETEQEKSENLNAAQSLVQMSESIDHKMNVIETEDVNNKDNNINLFKTKENNGIQSSSTVEQKVALLSSENNTDATNGKSPKFETTSSKLLKMLEEPPAPKTPVHKITSFKPVIIPGKEKILNFDVAKSSLKGKSLAPKQKIIIRRGPSNKTIINNLSEAITSPEKIFLSRNKPAQEGSIQTFTIQTSSDLQTSNDPKQIIIQPKIRKVTKPTKLQKIKPQNSLITHINEPKTLNETTAPEEPMFDINSMPVVLSDDILTPENIEKMPIVMSDGNIITKTTTPSNPPKLIKTKPTIIETEKVAISPLPSKPEVKTLLMTNASDVNKVTTPNILSKSSKLRGAKPMLVIDKATGKQKIIMTKADPAVKEIKQSPTLIQTMPQTTPKTTPKPEKFIILPSSSSPRPGRTQKIVIDPQTGQAHVLVAKGQETAMSVSDNKPVSAKLIPPSSDASASGNTVMIITNAHGAQSRIVLTPEHEKILFPNKQHPSVSQLKTITHRISTTTGLAQKTIVTSSAPAKTATRIVPKQKSAIITSKGQLIVGGRVTSTAQNIAPLPEIRPAPKRIVASEPKKLVQTIQKNSSEPLIFLQQKSGAVMQLTAAQFEHLQRTGQIIQKSPAPPQENKVIIQKSLTISPKETVTPSVQKQRVRKTATESMTPAKKSRQEIAIAPAPALSAPVPPLASLSSPSAPAPIVSLSSIVPTVSNTVSVATTPSYPELENFEELLPSTAIVRPSEPAPPVLAPAPALAPAPLPPPTPAPEPVADTTQLTDVQIMAVPGENFGGPPGSFYLCVKDNGGFTPIDQRPLMLENNELVPMAIEPVPVFAPQPERRDILEAALANSDVFHAETPVAPDYRDLNPKLSHTHCRVKETLSQPIMTPVEVPSKGDSEPTVPCTLEDGLAVIGVTPHTVPTSLELPITVTDPRIAPKTTDPLSNNNYGTTLLPSPNTEMTYVSVEETGPISMPLLTDEEAVGKSMPILTDEVAERAVSSVESTSSLEVRESEVEEGASGGGQWSRRLLTPGSDTSDASAEIPLQPAIQLSVNDLSHHS